MYDTGELCELEIDECKGLLCSNGGTCKEGLGYARCVCPTGYYGTHCDQGKLHLQIALIQKSNLSKKLQKIFICRNKRIF